jgi:hypothetical protein
MAGTCYRRDAVGCQGRSAPQALRWSSVPRMTGRSHSLSSDSAQAGSAPPPSGGRLCEGLPAISRSGEDVAMSSARPSVVDGLEVNEAQEGLIVFDPKSGLIHYLNSTAAFVFTMCDGTLSASEIASFVAEAFELDEPPLGEIERCLRTLGSKGLLR